MSAWLYNISCNGNIRPILDGVNLALMIIGWIIMLDFLQRLFGLTPPSPGLFTLYDRLVGQARLPIFYEDLEVPDTLDGRFDFLLLHVALLFMRLDKPEYRRSLRWIQDIMLDDITRGLREEGLGDAGVRVRIKQMGAAFLGRAKAYRLALEAKDFSALCEALDRNLYGTSSPMADSVEAVAHYTLALQASLLVQAEADLLDGSIVFPNPMPPERAPEVE